MFIRWTILLITASFVLINGISKPRHNWDMIGYVAAAHHKDGYRGTQLLERTYSELRAEVSPRIFSSLTEGQYRETVFKDPRALEQQVPFYSIRVLYIELMRLVSHLGISYAKSTYILSALFASFSVVVLYKLLLAEKISVLMLPVIVGPAGIVQLATLSAPDAMACFFSLLAALGLLSNNRSALFLAAVLPLIRTDFVLLSLLITCYEFARGKRRGSVASLAAAVTIYLTVNHFSGNYGWLTIFNFSLIALDPYPANLVLSKQFMNYIKPYASALLEVSTATHFVLYVLAIFTLAIRRRAALADPSAVPLLLIPLAFVILHLALFPTYEQRFFVAAATLVFVWLLHEISKQKSGSFRESTRT